MFVCLKTGNDLCQFWQIVQKIVIDVGNVWGRMGVYLGKNNRSIYFFGNIKYIDIFLSIYWTFRYILRVTNSLFHKRKLSPAKWQIFSQKSKQFKIFSEITSLVFRSLLIIFFEYFFFFKYEYSCILYLFCVNFQV